MKRFPFVLAFALLAALAAGGFYWYGRLHPTVTVAPVTRGPAVEAVYATAVVEPVNWSRVGPKETGRIAEVVRREGERVARGDVLARLDDREAQARIAELEARAKFADEEVKRQASLLQNQFASRQAYDRAVSDLGQVRAAIAAARQRLDDLVLRAPLDGVVLRRDGELGEIVAFGQTLFWVGPPRPLRAVAEVDEEDIPRVRPGQTALIKADAFAGRVLEGQVADITPKGDPIAKNYRVYVALPNETPLLIGMTLEINIVVRETPYALLVPPGALASGHVWVVEDDRVRRVPVQVGVQGSARVEVTGPLAEGQTVVVGPPAGLKDGQQVRPRPLALPL